MSDLVTTRIFTDGERGITAAKLNDITASSAIQPAFYTAKPTASTADPTDVALILKSGAYAQVPVSTLAGSINQAQIWSTRLTSFNAIGNPNFEVDQRKVGTGAAVVNDFALDRWIYSKSGTMTFSVVGQQDASASPVLLPGTSFAVSQNFCRFTLNAQQVTLGASDYVSLYQIIEGIRLRELIGDVHSLSLLVRSSVAGLKFGVALQDAGTTKSLVKLATISSANTWSLLTFPSLPSFPAGTTWSLKPGIIGCYLTICLAAGSNIITSANDTWQSNSHYGAIGQSNFATSVVNSTFDIAFVQHEPGAVCSTLMDKPFTQNYQECLRYYCKSMPYATPQGADNSGYISFSYPVAVTAANPLFGGRNFPVSMAKAPTMSFFKHDTGTLNQGYYYNSAAPSGAAIAFSGSTSNQNGIQSIQGNASLAGPIMIITGYTADTGW